MSKINGINVSKLYDGAKVGLTEVTEIYKNVSKAILPSGVPIWFFFALVAIPVVITTILSLRKTMMITSVNKYGYKCREQNRIKKSYIICGDGSKKQFQTVSECYNKGTCP